MGNPQCRLAGEVEQPLSTSFGMINMTWAQGKMWPWPPFGHCLHENIPRVLFVAEHVGSLCPASLSLLTWQPDYFCYFHIPNMKLSVFFSSFSFIAQVAKYLIQNEMVAREAEPNFNPILIRFVEKNGIYWSLHI